MFRAKRKDNGELVYGWLIKFGPNYFIFPNKGGAFLGGFIKVDPTTVAMKTFVQDKNKVDIYGSFPLDGVMTKGGDIVVHYNPVLDECYEDRMKHKTKVTLHNLQYMSPERRIRLEIIGTQLDGE